MGTKGDQKIQGNQFLWYDKKVSDFKLTLKVKQVPFAANAGIQFRSQREPNGHAVGYQADIGKGWWGSLYHEHGRRILAKNKDTAGKNLKPEKWNKYVAERDEIDIRLGLKQYIKKFGPTKGFDFQEDAYYGKVKGLLTHTNVRKGKMDCYPHPDFVDMIMSL